MSENNALKYIFTQILLKLLGICLLLVAICYALILFSFDGSDPAFSNSIIVANGDVHNFFGEIGAKIADLSLQIFGLASCFFVFFLWFVGAKIFNKQIIKYFALKLIILPFILLNFCLFLAFFPTFNWWDFSSFGGAVGFFLLKLFNENYFVSLFICSLLLTLLSFSFIFDVSWQDWRYLMRYAIAILRFFTQSIYQYLHQKICPVFTKKTSEIIVKKAKPLKITAELPEENSKENNIKTQKQLLKTIKNKQNNPSYQLPTATLLQPITENNHKKINKETLDHQAKMLLKVLEDFGVYGNSLGAKVGPVVTLHEFEPSAGTKAARVISLADDIARSMSTISARMAVIPGKTSIGIELPNLKRETIFFRELLESVEYQDSTHNLPIILGKNIAGEPLIADLAKMPHLLIAGTTGSGKSVGLNVMILSILFKLRPDECRFIMIDPKMLELSIYDGIPHLLSPVVTEPGKAVVALKWVVAEMEERYRLMSSFSVRNIAGYNEKAEKALVSGEKLLKKVQTGYEPTTGKPIFEEIEFEPKKLPFIVVIVDEMADLMLVAGKDIEGSVQRLAQMARAAGIHLIMATQRPSVDVITGVIKANFPTRISFQVTSRIDSRTILGVQGAEQLLGQGDMIYMSGGSKMIRIHAPFCSDSEIEGVVNFIKQQNFIHPQNQIESIEFEDLQQPEDKKNGSASFLLDEGSQGSDQDLYKQAVAIVKRDKKPSISYVQRQLRIGYNRAAILIEKMEAEGIISAPNISGKREILEE
jgi:S-DNA-T family DNA segregation ATPase FtsK/SpoIIIE